MDAHDALALAALIVTATTCLLGGTALPRSAPALPPRFPRLRIARLGRQQPPPVAKCELTILSERLEHADHLERRLVCLVDQEHAPEACGAHEGRVAPENLAVLDGRCEGERLDRRVAMQLDVLALGAQQLE